MYDIASAKEQLTIDNACWPSRFVTYTYTNPEVPTDGEIAPMTSENCNTENWKADDKMDNPTDRAGKIFSAVSALLKWIMALITKIFHLG